MKNKPDLSKVNSIKPASSIIIPGLGQYLTNRQTRGFIIFLFALVSGFLVNWSLITFHVAEVAIGGIITSWLWLPFIAFWIWNIFDAIQIGKIKAPPAFIGILLIAMIMYVVAWNVTEVKIERLVTRLSDAAKVGYDVINPDFFSKMVSGEEQRCSWDCLWTNLKAKIDGKPVDQIVLSDNIHEIFGKVIDKPAKGWRVFFGLDQPGEKVPTYITGKLIETIALGLMATIFSTLLAIPLSFLAARNVMSKVPGGGVIYYAMRTFLNIVRAVDTVVWGLLVIVWVGLGTFAGVIALTIHSMAALGKLYSEEIEHIDSGPVEAVTASGGNFLQVIRYAIIPQIIPSFLGYTLLRWDINMRSATVVGFVAGGGIGFFVLETIRMGGYQQYAAALWAVAVVIILVDYISEHWRDRILQDSPT